MGQETCYQMHPFTPLVMRTVSITSCLSCARPNGKSFPGSGSKAQTELWTLGAAEGNEESGGRTEEAQGTCTCRPTWQGGQLTAQTKAWNPMLGQVNLSLDFLIWKAGLMIPTFRDRQANER